MIGFTKYSHLPAYAEIANFEHELAVLKQRRANLHRFAKMSLRSLVAVLGVVALLFIYALMTDSSATPILFLLLFVVTFCALFTWAAKGTPFEKYLARLNSFQDVHGFWSHVDFLDGAIAAREQRLAELQTQP